MTTPDPEKINDLADRMPAIAAPLPDDDLNLLRGLFRAGAVAQLEAAGRRTDPRVSKADPRTWRIGMLPDPPGAPPDGGPTPPAAPGAPEPEPADPGPTEPGENPPV